MFAIILLNGKQYAVKQGDVLEVERLKGEAGDTITIQDVLLLETNGAITVGKPSITDAHVKAKIVEQGFGEKLEVRRYKAKVRYRKHIGFRPQITRLEISSISVS